MNIVDIAKQYFNLDSKGNGVYQIINPTGEFDSVVLWEATNSYRRFSIQKSGGPREFLKYVVGLSDAEIEEQYGLIGEDSLIRTLRKRKHHEKNDTGYSLQDIIFTPGYNQYIESRMVSKETAEYYHLEINDNDVAIPLYNTTQRIGSLYRNSHPDLKGDRYRTLLAGNNEKPCVWSFQELKKRKADTIIILVEGAWSVMRIHQVIKPYLPNILPLATLGTNITDELRDYIYEFPIIAILDNDTGGEHVAKQLMEWQKQKIKVEIYLPTIDKLSNTSSTYVDDLNDKMLIRLFKMIKNHSNFLDHKKK